MKRSAEGERADQKSAEVEKHEDAAVSDHKTSDCLFQNNSS